MQMKQGSESFSFLLPQPLTLMASTWEVVRTSHWDACLHQLFLHWRVFLNVTVIEQLPAPPYLTSSAWISEHANSLSAIRPGSSLHWSMLGSLDWPVVLTTWKDFPFRSASPGQVQAPPSSKKLSWPTLAADAQSKLTIWTHYSISCVDINHV